MHIYKHCCRNVLNHSEGTTDGLRRIKTCSIILIATGSWSVAFTVKNVNFRVPVELFQFHDFILVYQVWGTLKLSIFKSIVPPASSSAVGDVNPAIVNL